MQTPPMMFMASSVEDKSVLSEMANQLKSVVEPVQWSEDTSGISKNLMASIPHELNNCWVPNERDEVYHMFDAEFQHGLHNALGVSRFRFEKDRRNGHGYFVAYGAGGIKQGQISFDLERIDAEMLAARDLPHQFDFDNCDMCEALIRSVMGLSVVKRKRKT